MLEAGYSPPRRWNLSRYTIVFALFILSTITYVDRTGISTATTPIATELHLSDRAMGTVFSAFALGYAFGQIPAGWLADRLGARGVLAGAVVFWSLLTALTGAAWNLRSLLAFRFLFGASEAAAFPASAQVIRNRLPPEQRGRANGALFAGSRLGAALSYPLLVWLLTIWSWRNVFFILGIAGILWAASWTISFRHRAAETRRAQTVPYSVERDESAAATKPIAGLVGLAMAQYFASNFTNFLCLSWMFPYLVLQYHLSSSHAALYSMAPLLLGSTSQCIAGYLMDRMYASTLREWSRRLPAIAGFALAALGLALVIRAHSVGPAVLAFTLAIFGADLTISPSWVFCADIAGERTGSISGAMNMVGSIGAFASANAFPLLNRATGSSAAYFILAVGLNSLGVLCWIRMRSVHSSSLATLNPAEGN